jgi:caa(3)-type oxidase subunit IV
MSDGATSHALTTTPASSANARHERKATTSGGAPSHATATIAASPERIHHVQLEQKRFLLVYAVLIVGTVLTVGMYYVHFAEMWQTIAVALLIAAVKATFVAAVFMHLWHSERDIYRILLYTGVVAVGLFTLSILSLFSVPGQGLYPR